jgi:hypothetical protein
MPKQKSIFDRKFGTIQVEPDIPITTRRKKGRVENLEQMDVGDSFFISVKNPEQKRSALAMIQTCRDWGRARNRTFSYRFVSEGVRVWRTK